MGRELDAGEVHFLRHTVLGAGAPVVVAVGVGACLYMEAAHGGIVGGLLPVVHAFVGETVLQCVMVNYWGLISVFGIFDSIGGTEVFGHRKQDGHLLTRQCHAGVVGYHLGNQRLDAAGLFLVLDRDRIDPLIAVVDGGILVAYLEAIDHLPAAVALSLGLAHAPREAAAALYVEIGRDIVRLGQQGGGHLFIGLGGAVAETACDDISICIDSYLIILLAKVGGDMHGFIGAGYFDGKRRVCTYPIALVCILDV